MIQHLVKLIDYLLYRLKMKMNYTPKVETKDFNILIDRKSFFDTRIKNKEQAYEQIIKMNRNNDYTRDNLLNSNYYSKHYKLTAIYLSKQIELDNPDLKQQINFIDRLEEDNTTMFFITERLEETTFDFLKIL